MTSSKLLAAATLMLAGAAHAGAAFPPPLTESFDDVGALAAAGWSQVNNSSAGGSTGWFQGNDAVFVAASGAANAYIAANFENAPFGGAISNWLISPILSLDGGLIVDYQLNLAGEGFLDQVDVYLSTNGASTDVGTSSTSLGDFSTLQESTSASVATGWVAHSFAVAAQAGLGRIAFRYVVGDTSTAGNYVGIDSLQITSAVPEPASYALALLGLAVVGGVLRARGQARRAEAA